MSISVEFESISCHVRPARLADLPQVTDVLAASFYPPLGWQRWLYPLFRLSIHEDLKQRLQANYKHYQCLTAIAPNHQDSRVVGTIELACRQPELWRFNRPRQVYLSNLAVQAGYRRQGVARQLLKTAEQRSLDWGFRELYLHVMADNNRARLLYQNMGYQVHRIEPSLLSLLNLQPSRLLLKKLLTPGSGAKQSALDTP